MIRRSIAMSAALVGIFCFAGLVPAALVVNDTWRDGTDGDPASPVYAENAGAVGVDADVDGDLESAWFQGGGGTLEPVGAGGPLRGAVIGSSASWTTYFTPEATPVSLLLPNDRIRVTWVFTPTNVNTGSTSQDFRLAVLNSPRASRLVANGSPGSSTYQGYAMFMNMATTLGNSNPYQLREHDGNGAILGTSGDYLALANGVASGAPGYASGVQYTYVLTMTRTAAGELDIVSTMNGGTLNTSGTATVSFLDATPGTFSFDTFTVRPSSNTGTADQFDTSLFRVEFFTIPEPASVGLLSLGALVVLGLRRRV